MKMTAKEKLIENYLEKRITTEKYSDNYVRIWREL